MPLRSQRCRGRLRRAEPRYEARARAELTAAYATLLGADGEDVPSPLHLAERRHLDEVHRDGVRFPDGWLSPVVSSVQAVLDQEPAPEASEAVPTLEPVRPGSLGAWADDA